MGRDQVRQLPGRVGVRLPKNGGVGGGQDEGAVDSSGHTEWHDEPRLSLDHRERMGQLAVEHLRERCPRHWYRGEIRQRPSLARLEQHDSLALAEPYGKAELVERQNAPGEIRQLSGSLSQVSSGCEQFSGLTQQ
jgi:hypothetical protein